MIERIPLLLAVTLSVLFMAVGVWIYLNHHSNIQLQNLALIFALAAAIGTTFGFGVFPAMWFVLKFSFGSAFEESMYPGQSVDWLVLVIFFGTMSLALLPIWAMFDWVSGSRN
jgi:hypothetical protein